jgi:hypothetical protein
MTIAIGRRDSDLRRSERTSVQPATNLGPEQMNRFLYLCDPSVLFTYRAGSKGPLSFGLRGRAPQGSANFFLLVGVGDHFPRTEFKDSKEILWLTRALAIRCGADPERGTSWGWPGEAGTG